MFFAVEGIIARRILLNFRADAAIAQRLVPRPLEVQQRNGAAIVGVCLIRFEHLRPKGLPAGFGFSSENMAHRIAVHFPSAEGYKPGVFIWRRDTDQKLIHFFGGRLFPGVHGEASFRVHQDDSSLNMEVRTLQGDADVVFTSRRAESWNSTPAFSTFEQASEFFRQGDCGFSCSASGKKLEGMRLHSLHWKMAPLTAEILEIPFYRSRFPRGSLEFDCGLLMEQLPHEWRQLDTVPELVTAK